MITKYGYVVVIFLMVFSFGRFDIPSVSAEEASPASLAFAGSFSNMRFTEEHAYGYEVELWLQGDRLLGFLLASDGLQGDTPTALLENIRFDPATGQLEFNARIAVMTADLIKEDGKFKQVNRCDGRRFEFQGQLSKDRTELGGRLNSKTEDARGNMSNESVRLLRIEDDLAKDFKNEAEWKAYADGILKFRGPKC